MTRTVIIALLGPGEREFRRFTGLIASLRHFERRILDSSTLVVVNDGNLHFSIPSDNHGFMFLEVLVNPFAGTQASVLAYDRMMAGMMVALRRVTELADHDFVLKVDSDALACGAFGERIVSFFEAHPETGMIGSFHHHPDAELRANEWWWARSIRKTCGLFPSDLVRFHLKHKIPFHSCLTIKRWFKRYRIMKRAVKRGWCLGDNILGGAYALSPSVIKSFRHEKELFNDCKLFEGTRISEDVGISMMVGAMGFRLGEFNREGEVFGIWYQKPTVSMSSLVKNGYGLVHSLKADNPEDEAKMREQIAHACGMQLNQLWKD